jgi:hypothetical protein
MTSHWEPPPDDDTADAAFEQPAMTGSAGHCPPLDVVTVAEPEVDAAEVLDEVVVCAPLWVAPLELVLALVEEVLPPAPPSPEVTSPEQAAVAAANSETVAAVIPTTRIECVLMVAASEREWPDARVTAQAATTGPRPCNRGARPREHVSHSDRP